MKNAALIVGLGALALWLTTGRSKSTTLEATEASVAKPAARQPASAAVTSKPVISAVAKAAPQDEQAQRIAEFKRLDECLESHACKYPETDPRSYELAIGQEQRRLLREFREHFGKDPSAKTRLENLARHYIHSRDGFVQAEALAIFSSLPVDGANLQALSEGLASTPDAPLLKDAMNELQRYLGTPLETQVHSLLVTVMESGGHFSSQAAAENIYPFINASSFAIYSQGLNQIPPDTKVSHDLGAALREYRKLQTGA